jgi:hypothetical protein
MLVSLSLINHVVLVAHFVLATIGIFFLPCQQWKGGLGIAKYEGLGLIII